MSKNHLNPPLAVAAPLEAIAHRIFLIRSQKIMLDSALAELYEVPTFRLNEAVKRNQNRFPDDFMFRLTKEESDSLTSQFAISNGRGGRRTQPYASIELGVAMLSSVINSERAVQMNIVIMRAFVKLREVLATQIEQGSVIAQVVDEIEALRELPPDPPKRLIGFTSNQTSPDRTIRASGSGSRPMNRR